MKQLILSSVTGPGIQIGSPRLENGVPIYRYKKEVIRTGEYYKDADNLEFTVTPSTLSHWAAEFSRWTQNGNKVAIPETHKGAHDPSKNRGWVLDLFVEGNSLFATMDLYGEDAPKIACTNDVSIYSLPSVVDGKGVKYIRPITHIALCTDPVIPGLSPFEAIVASRLETFQMVKKLSSERNFDMNIMKIASTLGLSFGDKITDDEKETAVICALADLKEAADEKKKKKMVPKLDADGEEVLDDDGDVIMVPEDEDEDEDKKKKPIVACDETKKKKLKASRNVDPLLIKLSSENRGIKLDRLVEAGKITSMVRTELAKKYVEESVLAASLRNGGDDFDEIVVILAQNDIVELGERSNRQVMELGDILKNKENPLLADAKSRIPKKQ